MEFQSIESISTSYQKGKKYFDDSIRSGKIPFCSPGFVSGSCKGGHSFASVQFCGREYCRDCSRDGSPIHQRRVNKWWQRIEKWDSVAYLVITIPESVRFYFYDADRLRDFRFKCLRKLKESYNFNEGVARWHWFGDCENCAGRGCLICNETGSGNFWHPHLNILVPGGYVDDFQTYILPFKIWMFQYIKKLIDADIEKYKKLIHNGCDESFELFDNLINIRSQIVAKSLVINYSYVTDQAMKMNRVKYITRSTFRRFNQSVKDVLYNFRNCVVWGWKKGEDIPDDEFIKYCPECESKGIQHRIHWHRLKKFESNDKIKKHESTGKNKMGLFYIRRNKDRSRGNHSTSDDFVSIVFRSTKKISINPAINNEDLWHSILFNEGFEGRELGNHG